MIRPMFSVGLLAISLGAQSPEPVLSLSVNASREAVAMKGSPILVRAMLLHSQRLNRSSAVPALRLAPPGLTWADAIRLEVRDEKGAEQAWSFHLVASPENPVLELPHRSYVDVEWALPADASSGLPAGAYQITARLVSRNAQGWNGEVSSGPVSLRIVEEGESTPDITLRAAMMGAHIALRQGDVAEASRLVDRVLSADPASVPALRFKAQLLEVQGQMDMAFLFSTLALRSAAAKKPDPKEPPAELLLIRNRLLSLP